MDVIHAAKHCKCLGAAAISCICALYYCQFCHCTSTFQYAFPGGLHYSLFQQSQHNCNNLHCALYYQQTISLALKCLLLIDVCKSPPETLLRHTQQVNFVLFKVLFTASFIESYHTDIFCTYRMNLNSYFTFFCCRCLILQIPEIPLCNISMSTFLCWNFLVKCRILALICE